MTYCGVVGGDIEQNLGGASAGDVSVAVPHTRDQVGLTPHGRRTNTHIRHATHKKSSSAVFCHPPIHWSSEQLLEQPGPPSAADIHPPARLGSPTLTINQLRGRFNALTAGLFSRPPQEHAEILVQQQQRRVGWDAGPQQKMSQR